MNIFQFHYPISQTISADDYHEAVIKYIKLYRQHNIERFIVSDYMKNYQNAVVKYFKENGKNKVKVNFGPYNGPIGVFGQNVEDGLLMRAHPTLTPQGVVPSVDVKMNGFGPSKLLVPMLKD
jgi:hypothetical protein